MTASTACLAAAIALRCGFVLTLNYGYPAEKLYASWRKDATLLCFYRHNPGTDPHVRLAVTKLIDPAGLGRIKVPIQAKGIGQPKPWALGGSEP